MFGMIFVRLILFPHFPPNRETQVFLRFLHHLDRHSLASFSVAFQGKQRAHLTHQHLTITGNPAKSRVFFRCVFSKTTSFENKMNSEMILYVYIYIQYINSKSGPTILTWYTYLLSVWVIHWGIQLLRHHQLYVTLSVSGYKSTYTTEMIQKWIQKWYPPPDS